MIKNITPAPHIYKLKPLLSLPHNAGAAPCGCPNLLPGGGEIGFVLILLSGIIALSCCGVKVSAESKRA